MQLRDLLRFVILACLFATPFICLIVAENMFFPFITGKNFTFRILVEVMLGAWALLMFLDSSYRPKYSHALGAAGAFLVVIAVADMFGVNPHKSFWSNYERMEGLIAHAHLFLYFVMAGTIVQTEKLWHWFFKTNLAASMIVGIHGFSQIAGKADIHQSDARIDASFGNATYLAVYNLFMMFLAMFLFFREGKNTTARWIYALVALANGVMMYFTQTRGAILGLIGGAFLAFALVALFEKGHAKLRKLAFWGIGAVVAVVMLFFALKDTSVVQSSYTLKRFADISLTDLTTSSRFMIWEMSWEGFKERPILGWGQENFLYVFSKHYDPKMWNQEPWFDRSHDVFFDWLIAGGALGLLSYLSMFGAAIWIMWWKLRERLSVVERAILTGMLAGYFVHNIFVFDNLTSYLAFFALLAYLHALSVDTDGGNDHKSKKDEPRALEAQDAFVAGALIIAITAGLIYAVNIRNINANVALIDAIKVGVKQVGNGKFEIPIAEIASKDLFGRTEAREQLGQMSFQALDPRIPAELRNEFYELTSRAFEDEIVKDPENMRTRSFAGMFYARYGKMDKALEHYEKAIELSPTRQSTYLDLTSMYLNAGDFGKALANAKIAYELEPAYPEPRIFYAMALIYNSEFDKAGELMQGLAGTPQYYDQRIVNAYGNSKRFDKVIELVNEKIAKGEATGRDYFSLAGSYLELGQKPKAIESIETAITMDASLKEQGEQFIQSIKTGKPL